MRKVYNYDNGIKCILTDEGTHAKLVVKNQFHKIEVTHADIGFLYEMKENYVETFKKFLEKEEIFKLKKMLD